MCKETGKPWILGRRWSAMPGRRENGSIVSLFCTLARVEDERYLNWKSQRAVPATTEEPLATDLQDKPPPLGAWVALFRDDSGETREAAASRVQGAHPWRRAR